MNFEIDNFAHFQNVISNKHTRPPPPTSHLPQQSLGRIEYENRYVTHRLMKVLVYQSYDIENVQNPQ